MAKKKTASAKASTTAVGAGAKQTPPDTSNEQKSTPATEAGPAGTGASASTAKAEASKAPDSPTPEAKAKPDPAKDAKPASGEMTPVQKAAKFVGIPVDQVFDFAEKEDGRFVVVTVSGHKFTNTPGEREAAAKQAVDEAKARAAHKAAKAAR